ncbi:MAG: ABC transporter substrate-binding protein, partial [Eubacteriales bacterium]
VNTSIPAAALLVAKYGIIPSAALAEKAIPTCNITFIVGKDMKAIAKQNFDVLFKANPSSIGGAEPKDDFYYGA